MKDPWTASRDEVEISLTVNHSEHHTLRVSQDLDICGSPKYSQMSTESLDCQVCYVSPVVHYLLNIKVLLYDCRHTVLCCVAQKNPFLFALPTFYGHCFLLSLMKTTKRQWRKKNVFFTHSRRVFRSWANCTVWNRGGDMGETAFLPLFKYNKSRCLCGDK